MLTDRSACVPALTSFFIFIVPLQISKSGKKGLEVRAGNGSGGGSAHGRVGNKAGLCLLLALLPLFAKSAVDREMHTLRYALHRPIVSVFAQFLALLFAILG